MTVTINGSTGIDKVQDGIVTDTKLNLTANSAEIKEALNASNGAPIYACRAWVNFNGTGTVAIRGSGNVSSISDNGTGDYRVNFTTSMPDTNYGFIITATSSTGGAFLVREMADQAAGSLNFRVGNTSANADLNYVQVSIFR